MWGASGEFWTVAILALKDYNFKNGAEATEQ